MARSYCVVAIFFCCLKYRCRFFRTITLCCLLSAAVERREVANHSFGVACISRSWLGALRARSQTQKDALDWIKLSCVDERIDAEVEIGDGQHSVQDGNIRRHFMKTHNYASSYYYYCCCYYYYYCQYRFTTIIRNS